MTIQAWERTPFVGREPERDHLRRLIEGAAAGRGGLAVIAGEPGIGKTRLVGEAAAEAVSAGVRTIVGHCEEGRGSPPKISVRTCAPSKPMPIRAADTSAMNAAGPQRRHRRRAEGSVHPGQASAAAPASDNRAHGRTHRLPESR